MRRALSLALVGFAACAEREAGLSVQVTLEVHQASLGTAYDTATLAVEAVRLTPCPQAHWLKALWPIGTAWAHAPDAQGLDPRVSTRGVLVQLQAAGPQHLATLSPPPGALCGVELTVAPSTVDARSRGTSLLLEAPGVFQLATDVRQGVVSLDARPLDESHRELGLALQLDFGAPTSSGAGTVAQLLGSLR